MREWKWRKTLVCYDDKTVLVIPYSYYTCTLLYVYRLASFFEHYFSMFEMDLSFTGMRGYFVYPQWELAHSSLVMNYLLAWRCHQGPVNVFICSSEIKESPGTRITHFQTFCWAFGDILTTVIRRCHVTSI